MTHGRSDVMVSTGLESYIRYGVRSTPYRTRTIYGRKCIQTKERLLAGDWTNNANARGKNLPPRQRAEAQVQASGGRGGAGDNDWRVPGGSGTVPDRVCLSVPQ